MPRILIIDDDDAFRTMLRLSLRRLGHEVEEAANGRQGLLRQRTEPADLVITDLIMPEKEGLETIRELRAEFPALKIIAISGGGRVNPRDFLKIAGLFGAQCTLEKPFSIADLAGAIDAVLAAA